MEETGTAMENALKPLTPFKLETDSNTVHTVCLSIYLKACLLGSLLPDKDPII